MEIPIDNIKLYVLYEQRTANAKKDNFGETMQVILATLFYWAISIIYLDYYYNFFKYRLIVLSTCIL